MKYWLLCFCFFSSCVIAADLYPFHSRDKQKQFDRLLTQLRCVVCQNEDLASSNASIANDLRLQVYDKVQAGESDQAIKLYLTKRYGNFILFKPPFIASTYFLWLAPFVFLLIGLWVFISFK